MDLTEKYTEMYGDNEYLCCYMTADDDVVECCHAAEIPDYAVAAGLVGRWNGLIRFVELEEDAVN